MFKARKPRPAASASPDRAQIKTQIEERTYSSIEVADVAQVSLRQLQWWDERKVVSPRHEGHRRIYFAAEVIEITVIAELRRKGFSLQKIRRVL
ncbi:MAG TPA: MerR family transcriptional regulator, partial [Bryobacteraceae bacterium]|nr:MerR family transcriptional regulator [Bryobacteraceae bacterium]